MMRIGNKLEEDFSLSIHKSHLPVLISSQVLRSFNAGQIDLSGLKKINQTWVLYIYEVKSSRYPSPEQWKRLKKAQDYLSKVLEIETKLDVLFCQKDEP